MRKPGHESDVKNHLSIKGQINLNSGKKLKSVKPLVLRKPTQNASGHRDGSQETLAVQVQYHKQVSVLFHRFS